MPSIIPVPLPQQAYPIILEPGILNQVGPWLSSDRPDTGLTETYPLKLGRKVLVVSNPEIFEHYGDRLLHSLDKAGFEVFHHLIPAGEQHKHLGSIQAIYDTALAHRLERSSTFIALGGGVVGDMTGFAAATWLRGVNFVQVPTSLLAMVDAAIGGKTGVNHPEGKNLIGAFYQPKLVLIDPAVLKTLPTREFRAGMAEVIKYGVIWSPPLFEALEASETLDERASLSDALLSLILQESCGAKAAVVSQDEKEAGLRAILNYGHTLGHGVESLMHYQGVNHGEAVAIGMVAAGALAVALGLWTTAEQGRQVALIEKAGLPTRLPPGLEIETLLEALKKDKKVQENRVRFVLPEAIGRVRVTDAVPSEVIRSVLQEMQVG